MTILEGLAVLVAGTCAGMMNTVVGAGSLVTFPTLIGLGYGPVVANVSNNVGLVLGGVSGTVGYRRELVGQRRRAAFLAVASLSGGLTGAVLLLTLSRGLFRAVVPVLIGMACVLVLVQPWVTRLRGELRPDAHRPGPALYAIVFATGVYGGYFGAAQGVLLLAFLGLFLHDALQRLNALKNVLAACANLAAALLFVLAADVDWAVAGLIAAGSIAGGQLGAHVGRRLPAPALRIVVVVIGIAAIVRLLA